MNKGASVSIVVSSFSCSIAKTDVGRSWFSQVLALDSILAF